MKPVLFETLEDRTFMSVAVHAAAPAPAVHAAAIHVAAKPAPKPVVKAAVPTVKAVVAATYVAGPRPDLSPNVTGRWTGTMLVDGTKTPQVFGVNFAFQRGVAASGTFNLGPAMGGQSVVSTMVFSTHLNVRVMFSTPKMWGGITGVLSSDHKTLFGRYAYNSPTGWQTGTFTLARA